MTLALRVKVATLRRLKLNFISLTHARRMCTRLIVFAALTAPIIVAKISTAGFEPQDVRPHVEIDGVNFGSFDSIEGLQAHSAKQAHVEKGQRSAGFHRILLKRDFVTDPSLYLWAKNIMHGRSELKDIHVMMETPEGEELSHYILRFCQPLSWTVEAANPALGGFHETIELAVQEITTF